MTKALLGIPLIGLVGVLLFGLRPCLGGRGVRLSDIRGPLIPQLVMAPWHGKRGLFPPSRMLDRVTTGAERSSLVELGSN